jgi:hypothetical protein
VASGGTLSTEGTADGVYIQAPLVNQAGGTVTIGSTSTIQNDNTPTSDAGTLQVENDAGLALSSGSTLTATSTGTLGVTVNGTEGGISGPGVALDSGSTLAVTTVGSPGLGTPFTPIGGPVTGTFSNFAFGPHAYTVTYPSGAVVLTTVAPFTVSPTAFSPKEYEQTGSVQVASIGSANLGTGTYSATVDWGDGKPIQSATVNITGPTGTVTAPTHKYKSAGPFTVTVTVANTDGTTEVATQTVTVTGPTITSFSPSSGPAGTTVTINGSDLTATAVLFNGVAGTITHNSATKLKVTVPLGATTGKIKVETTPGNGKTATFFTVT